MFFLGSAIIHFLNAKKVCQPYSCYKTVPIFLLSSFQLGVLKKGVENPPPHLLIFVF